MSDGALMTHAWLCKPAATLSACARVCCTRPALLPRLPRGRVCAAARVGGL